MQLQNDVRYTCKKTKLCTRNIIIRKRHGRCTFNNKNLRSLLLQDNEKKKKNSG